MNAKVQDILWGGAGGAVIAALITWGVTEWTNHQRDVRELDVKEAILDVKEQYLGELRDTIEQAAKLEERTETLSKEVETNRRSAVEEIASIKKYADTAKNIVEKVTVDANLDEERLIGALTPIVESEIQEISNSHLKAIEDNYKGTIKKANCQIKQCQGGDWIECSCPVGSIITGGGCNAISGSHHYQISMPLSLTKWQCGGHGGNKQIALICCK